MKNFNVIASCALLAVPFFALSAQSVSAEAVQELSQCSAYVQKTALIAPLSSELSEIIKGGSIVFQGEIIYTGAVPLADTELYVKVVSLLETRVVALIPVPVPPLGSESRTPFEVAWDVPVTLSAGQYAAESVVYRNGRYAPGADFSSALVSPYEFRVVGEPPESIQFDLSKTTVNGGKPDSEAGIIRAPQDGALSVSVPILNDMSGPLKSKVVWSIYAWDGPRKDRLLDTTQSEVKAHPRSEGVTTFTIEDAAQSEYFIMGTLDVRGEPLTIYARVARLGHRDIKLTTAGIGSGGNGSTEAYVCVTSPDTQSDDVRIELSAGPTFWGAFFGESRAVYEGSVAGGIDYALTLPQGSGGGVARLYHGGELVDELAIPNSEGKGTDTWATLIGFILLLGLTAALLYKYLHR